MILTETLKEMYQLYFSKKLLKHAINILHLMQFAETQELPKRSGAKRIRFFRPQVADTSTIVALGEGVPINTFDVYKYDTVDFDLVQYGQAARLSDIAEATELWDHSKNQVMKFAESAALWADTLIRESIVQPTGGLITRFTNGNVGGATFDGYTATQAQLTPFDILDAITQLRVNLSPTINGGYVAILPPQGVRDIQTNTSVWTLVKAYSDAEDLYKGETGSLYGVRCVWATNPMIEASAANNLGVYNAAGTILTTIVTGMGAFACPRLSGDKPDSPKMMVVDTADSFNPLRQFITIGWKLYFSAGVLNPRFGLQIKHKTPWVTS
jgi:N4-gp56 family major capsid protein